MSVDSRAPAEPTGGAGSAVVWPVRSGLVPPLAEGFVARPESAPGLGQVLTPGACVALTPRRQGAVAPGSPDWPGSCGKTQLATYLAESLWTSHELDLLVWVTATSRASILSAYAAAAAAVIGIDPAGDAETIAARFTAWLAETSRPWLVVLDDLSAPADAEALWPAGPAGRTLVTTAEPVTAFARPQLVAFPVTGLSRREALGYLLGRLTDDRGQRSGAIDLVDVLGGEPLAISQAGAVLDSSALSCREYTDRFNRKRDQLAGGFQGRPAAAAISWTLCVEQAYRLLPGGPVQPVLILASVLDGHAIPGSVFTTAAASEYAGHPEQGPASHEAIWSCVSCLQTAGLLTVDRAAAPPVVRMHPAVQAAVRTAASREALGRSALAAADALLEIWPADDSGGWLAGSLRASALTIIRLAGELLWSARRYELLFRTGRSLEDAHLTMLAAAHWNHVAAASERYLGPEHPDALSASDHLASAFLTAGRALEALPWFRRVLADRLSLLGPEHPATIEFEVRMGRALLAAGRSDEAVALFERVASDRTHLYGVDHPDTLDARDALADAYCAAGRVTDGIRQYQRTLSERERGQGSTHPATMATTMKLADAYLADGRLKESISAHKRVVTGRERRLAADHPDTIEARSRLAAAYQAAGKMAIAVQLHERARDDSERVLGVDHLDTLTRQVHLAHAYYAVGRIGDAASVLRDAAERGERVLPADAVLLQTVRESLANITG